MKVFQDIFISIKDLSDDRLLNLFSSFCRSNSSYKLNIEKSKKYSTEIDGRMFIIEVLGSSATEPAGITIAEKTTRTLYVANIVPRNKNQLSVDEYNLIASNFYRALRQHINVTKSKATIKISHEDIGLKEIIPGKVSREYFQRYLNTYPPLSSHPSDIKRLDSFICALFRYKSEVSFPRLKQYLIVDLGWKEKDASWCEERIQTGLEILSVNKKFY